MCLRPLLHIADTSFNRTFMELKFWILNRPHHEVVRFNRTFMELKFMSE